MDKINIAIHNNNLFIFKYIPELTSGLATPDRDLEIIPDLEPSMEFLYGLRSDEQMNPVPLLSLGGEYETDCLSLNRSIDCNCDGDCNGDCDCDGEFDIEFDSKDNNDFSFCIGEFG